VGQFTDWMMNLLVRAKALEAELARSADPDTRNLLQGRLEEMNDDWIEFAEAVTQAAATGDAEAKRIHEGVVERDD